MANEDQKKLMFARWGELYPLMSYVNPVAFPVDGSDPVRKKTMEAICEVDSSTKLTKKACTAFIKRIEEGIEKYSKLADEKAKNEEPEDQPEEKKKEKTVETTLEPKKEPETKPETKDQVATVGDFTFNDEDDPFAHMGPAK